MQLLLPKLPQKTIWEDDIIKRCQETDTFFVIEKLVLGNEKFMPDDEKIVLGIEKLMLGDEKFMPDDEKLVPVIEKFEPGKRNSCLVTKNSGLGTKSWCLGTKNY